MASSSLATSSPAAWGQCVRPSSRAGLKWASEDPRGPGSPPRPSWKRPAAFTERGGANHGSDAALATTDKDRTTWIGVHGCRARRFARPSHSEEVSMDTVCRVDHQVTPGFDRSGKGWAKIGSIAALGLAVALPVGGQAVQEREPDAVVRLFELLDVVSVDERAASGRFSGSVVPMFDVTAGALSVRIAAVKRRRAADRALGATGETRTCRYTNAKAAQSLEHAVLKVADCDDATVAEPPIDRITHVTVTVREDGEDWKLACQRSPEEEPAVRRGLQQELNAYVRSQGVSGDANLIGEMRLYYCYFEAQMSFTTPSQVSSTSISRAFRPCFVVVNCRNPRWRSASAAIPSGRPPSAGGGGVISRRS